jgi:hypothetical protein
MEKVEKPVPSQHAIPLLKSFLLMAMLRPKHVADTF